ncbi:PilT/PilU family type 4a pilus ATPase [Beggiatoa leptomitoformis]|uniref:PilT/PilU family type 4a pilus ATPase n=1 Tax=Beggiatoa leptomitoformis TaxID=288004 RepID=A0A2N9YIX1_9GAMM|nr:PilT/PilU family type 4a pilus ATPase [Beggiatoa leptomitoformis]ALG69324.2 PilT/PilU family type 4a pilus ATPase [Beggiatoa leptomitoformis]AUI70491.2 PilT/PilU family type 4a pilus ATPase [Beggiatoa leptomitoformis]
MDLVPYFKLLTEKNGSELVLIAGSVVKMKIDGEEKPVGKSPLTPEMTKAAAFNILSEAQKKQLSQAKEIEFEYKSPNTDSQYQVMITLNAKGVGLVLRPLKKSGSKTPEATKAPPATNSKTPTFSFAHDEGIRVLGGIPTKGRLDILPYLDVLVKQDGSDFFLTTNSPPCFKKYGKIVPMDEYMLTPELTKSAVYGIMTDEQIEEFEKTKDLDFAIALPDDSARFRANAFYQRRTIGLVMRLIPSKIPTIADLNLPEILQELIMQKRGLLIMVGGTGSGKSTSLAAMINYRNQNNAGHILTIEDPVEFSHPNILSLVNQREVGTDTVSYARALKASLREAPDVILVGEIRDRETMEAGLELANTGHLCLATMHSNNANQALDRVVNMFPHEMHNQLFMDLSLNLRGVVSQRLIPDVRGKRAAAIEVLINTPHIASLILKGQLNEVKDAMLGSGVKGMKAFDDALYDLYKDGRISLEEALKNADSRNNLEARINFG